MRSMVALSAGVSAIPGAKAVGRVATKYLTPSGGADPRVFEEMMDTRARIDATERVADACVALLPTR